jgi:dTDP-4-dehydrorhamnose 3,5-epimerase
MFEFIPTTIPDVLIIKQNIYADERGFFLETYRYDQFCNAGIDVTFVQDNHSGSKQGILRGLHYQIQQTQGKLVRVVQGEVFDVAVDMRRSSDTFGQWVGMILSSKNKFQLWVPPGFAHGFYVRSEWAEVTYKNTDYYAPDWERTLLWSDPKVGVDWPLLDGKPPILSPKDAVGKTIDEAELFD